MSDRFALFTIFVFVAGLFAMMAAAFGSVFPLIGTVIFLFLAVRTLMSRSRS